MPSSMRLQQRWPRGPVNELHRAAHHGSSEKTIALLSMGSINIDQGTPEGWTPLMFAAGLGHSSVANILLNEGADVSIATDEGVSALHVCAEHGHSEVMAALIDAGAHVNCRSENGRTPLFAAAANGRLAAVKALLSAKANPLLGMTDLAFSLVPLDVAARQGHSEVVRELIQQVGIEGCGGEGGGVNALRAASQMEHVEVMEILAGAGVVDPGIALYSAAASSREAAVKSLLQQQRRRGPTVGYVNFSSMVDGSTVLYRSIDVSHGQEGVPYLISSKVVRLIIDAGADTSSAVRITDTAGQVTFNDTPLAFTITCLRTRQLAGRKASEEQMNRLEAVRRLLLRVEAVHAVSWLWVREPLLVGGAAEDTPRTKKTAASGTQLALMLPVLRRRGRGALLVPMLRYASYP